MPATIQLGSKGPLVKRVQRVFARELLWNPFGPITGLFDAGLEASVKNWQQSANLTVDGIVGPQTWASLPAYQEVAPDLKPGDTGPVVAWLQQTLAGKNIGIEFLAYSGPIDGIYGPLTEASVKSMQAWAKVKVTGCIDEDDWFLWMTPGSAQQLRLEEACGLLTKIFP
jgi:peptidoglycan hydrolase-like protein with peptidoglycan-binding domain